MNDVDRTRDDASTAQRAGEATTEELGQAARAVRDEAGAQARRTGERARDGVKRSLEGQKSKLSHRIGAVAEALREGSATFRERDEPDMEAQGRSLADRVEGVQHFIDDYSVDRAVDDLGNLARRRPVWLAGAALAAAAAVGAVYMGARASRSR